MTSSENSSSPIHSPLSSLSTPSTPVILLMGVSGAGKTEIGGRLAARLGWGFFDADDYHPPKNIQKLSLGQALSDKDRLPWLDDLRALLGKQAEANKPTVLACSALKGSHRDVLQSGPWKTWLIHLEGRTELIAERLQNRKGHFFDPSLLGSQLQTLEPPEREDALILSIDGEPETIVDEALSWLKDTAGDYFPLGRVLMP